MIDSYEFIKKTRKAEDYKEFTSRGFCVKEQLTELIINKDGIKINGEDIDFSSVLDMNIHIESGIIEISGNYMKRFEIGSGDSKNE